MPTLFFSWQSDTEEKTGRFFVREALQLALAGLASDFTVEESHRALELYHDTKGVPGSSPLVDTIIGKIRAASVFVSDMTYVGDRLKRGKSPNPNVLIEYGVAIEAVTHQRVISVMNTAFGSPEDHELPFDLRHVRWPLRYHLAPDADKATTRRVQLDLVKSLAAAIRSVVLAAPLVAGAAPVFARAPQAAGQASFRGSQLIPLGNVWDPIPFIGGIRDKVVLMATGPSMWVRLIPTTAPKCCGRRMNCTARLYRVEFICLYFWMASLHGIWWQATDSERGSRPIRRLLRRTTLSSKPAP